MCGVSTARSEYFSIICWRLLREGSTAQASSGELAPIVRPMRSLHTWIQLRIVGAKISRNHTRLNPLSQTLSAYILRNAKRGVTLQDIMRRRGDVY